MNSLSSTFLSFPCACVRRCKLIPIWSVITGSEELVQFISSCSMSRKLYREQYFLWQRCCCRMSRIPKVTKARLAQLKHISKEEMNNGQSALPNEAQLGNIRNHIIVTAQRQQGTSRSCPPCIASVGVADWGLRAAVGNRVAGFALALHCVGRR